MNKRRQLINKIVKIGIFAAIAVVLYHFTFPIPLFPSFLKVNFSMMMIIIVGLMYGPLSAELVIIIRFLIGILTSGTGGVGETADLIIGTLTIIPSALIYKFNRNKKGGYIAVIVAFIMWVISGTLSNLITIPIYVKILSMDKVLGAISAVIPNVTKDNYLSKYIIYGALPFNILISFIVCTITLIFYKHISNIFKHDFFSKSIKSKNSKGKIMVMIDSFKGTITSKEANQMVKEKLEKKGYQVNTIPISDGGEGFLDTIQSIINQPFFSCIVNDALFRKHDARYIYDELSKTAYVEMAECCGIHSLKENELDAINASSYGLGEQIKYIVEHNDVEKIVVGIGGSASSDAGTGMLEALGANFYDEFNEIITHMNNCKLTKVKTIRVGNVKNLFKNIKIEVLTDVVNPLFGPTGAVHVFAKQKGAKSEQLPLMEENIKYFYNIVGEQVFGSNNQNDCGDGAAGGVGYAFNQIIKAKTISGSDKILSLLNFEQICKTYDIIITGEGKFDNQTADGKIIQGIMKYQPKRLIIVTGIAEIETTKAEVFAIVPKICDLETSLKEPYQNFKKLIDNLPL